MSKQQLLIWVIVLLIPIAPFLLLADFVEPAIESIAKHSIAAGRSELAATVIFLGLTLDIFLPIPSAVLMTFAGRYFGTTAGTLLCWLGLNASACVGFWLGQTFGARALMRLTSNADVKDLQTLRNRERWWFLLACRPLPIIAEASVLMAGTHRMGWRNFLPPILTGNLIVAVAHAALGDYAAENEWFAAAVVISMVTPALFFIGWRLRQWLDRNRHGRPDVFTDTGDDSENTAGTDG